ncbi:Heat shock protein [Quillaja saponaria]|uniref:Heat shock protein n=1 Tax=Quillaja saponaria TaxID=32244 RepID=A0AAD7KVX5_QUISA|nr:Heat shock protein [Quillaja saponaria]
MVASMVDSKEKHRVELILKYIEDGDLRRWSMPDIRAFNIGLSECRSICNCITNPYMYEQESEVVWSEQNNKNLFQLPGREFSETYGTHVLLLSRILTLLELTYEDLVAKGNSYLSSCQNAATELLDKVFKVRFGRGFYGECLGVRADGNSNFSYEIGQFLSSKSAAAGLRSIGAVIFMQQNNLKMCLRSMDGDTDTSEVAKTYGGGGSRSSSSFIIRMDEYEQWLSVNPS